MTHNFISNGQLRVREFGGPRVQGSTRPNVQEYKGRRVQESTCQIVQISNDPEIKLKRPIVETSKSTRVQGCKGPRVQQSNGPRVQRYGPWVQTAQAEVNINPIRTPPSSLLVVFVICCGDLTVSSTECLSLSYLASSRLG